MRTLIQDQAQLWLPVVLTILGLMCVIGAGIRAFHPKHGSISSGIGYLLGGAVFLAMAAAVPWIVDKAGQDINGPAVPATQDVVGD